jgi:hypothetical protein
LSGPDASPNGFGTLMCGMPMCGTLGMWGMCEISHLIPLINCSIRLALVDLADAADLVTEAALDGAVREMGRDHRVASVPKRSLVYDAVEGLQRVSHQP